MSLIDERTVIFKHRETGEEIWLTEESEIEYMEDLAKNPNEREVFFEKVGTLAERKATEEKSKARKKKIDETPEAEIVSEAAK